MAYSNFILWVMVEEHFKLYSNLFLFVFLYFNINNLSF